MLGVFIFLSLDFYESCHSLTSCHLITEVKQQWGTLVLGCMSFWVRMYLTRNLFWLPDFHKF